MIPHPSEIAKKIFEKKERQRWWLVLLCIALALLGLITANFVKSGHPFEVR